MMRLKQRAAIATLAALPLAVDMQQSEAAITVRSRTENPPPKIIVRSIYDFEQQISLKVKTDPKMEVSDALIKTVSKLEMFDAHGVAITSGFDVDPAHKLVLAFSGGTSEIIKASKAPNGWHIIGSFRDEYGNFISPPPGSLAVYTMNGEKLCFDYKTVQQAAPKMGIALLLDRSGSMYGNMDSVKSAAQDFLNILPKSAECAVGSFDTSITYSHMHYQSCSGGGFGFETIEAGGGTDIYVALKDAYTVLSGSYFNGYQKAVIIITDGYTMNDAARKQELLGLKHDILTFVYFIGGDRKDELEEITDHFIAQGGNLKQSLAQYFNSIGQAYNTQKVLAVRQCQGGRHAAP